MYANDLIYAKQDVYKNLSVLARKCTKSLLAVARTKNPSLRL